MSYGQKNATLNFNTPVGSTPPKVACSGQMCMNNPIKAFKISFTYEVGDNPDEIWKDEILNNVNKNINLTTTPILPLTEYSNWGSVQILTPFTLNGNGYAPLNTLDDSKWLFIVKLFALNFGFSPNRIVNVTMDPIFSNNKVTSIDVTFTIANFIENPNNKINIPGPDGSLPNDTQSAICLGLWILDSLESGVDLEFLSNSAIPDSIKNLQRCKRNPGVNPKVLRQSVKKQLSPSSSDYNISHFTNIQGNILNDNNVVEHLRVNTADSGSVNVKPNTILDYVFMFAYLISFIGAIFFSMASLVQIDPSTIIANKNVSFAINLFIGVCGLVSMIIWVNFDIDFDILYLFGLNQEVVKQSI